MRFFHNPKYFAPKYLHLRSSFDVDVHLVLEYVDVHLVLEQVSDGWYFVVPCGIGVKA